MMKKNMKFFEAILNNFLFFLEIKDAFHCRSCRRLVARKK